MNADGGTARRLIAGSDPSWSPDGKRIAFVSGGGSPGAQIFVINADGSLPLALTAPDQTAYVGTPVWSPDGRRIAFTRAKCVAGGCSTYAYQNIWVMNADGSKPRQLTKTPDLFTNFADPAWSPNGGKIAYDGGRGCGDGIYVINADGTNRHLLTHSCDGNPAWSPDGSQIAFNSGRNNAAHSQRQSIYVINADGNNVRQLTP
jgi:TolB protein